jgi:hypothetical protein
MANDPKTMRKKGSAGSAQSAAGTPAQTTAGSETPDVDAASAEPTAGTSVSPVAGALAPPVRREGARPTAGYPALPEPMQPASGAGHCGKTVNLGFYDADTLAQLLPADGTELEFHTIDGDSCGRVTLTQNKNTPLYSVSLPTNLPAPTPNPTENEETLCGIPKNVDTALVALSSVKPLAINCQSYFMPSIAIAVHTAEQDPNPFGSPTFGTRAAARTSPAGQSSSTKATDMACAINIPLTRLEESYTAKFFAFDTCFKDYLLNAKALINQVSVTATPVKTQSSVTAAGQNAARVAGHTVDGFAELSGLIPHQLYRIEVNGPREYVCMRPPHPYLCNPTAKNVRVEAHFQPCGKFPARSVIFVQDGCPGLRVPKLSLQAGGQPAWTDENGIWNVPAGTTGIVEFQALGKTFSPASIDLNNDTGVAFMVGVADQTVAHSARPGGRRFYFVDEKGEPFKHRKLHLRSHNGHESTIYTDPRDGGFDADDGWVAWADEDESGHAVAAYPLLIARV